MSFRPGFTRQGFVRQNFYLGGFLRDESFLVGPAFGGQIFLNGNPLVVNGVPLTLNHAL